MLVVVGRIGRPFDYLQVDEQWPPPDLTQHVGIVSHHQLRTFFHLFLWNGTFFGIGITVGLVVFTVMFQLLKHVLFQTKRVICPKESGCDVVRKDHVYGVMLPRDEYADNRSAGQEKVKVFQEDQTSLVSLIVHEEVSVDEEVN